MNATKDLFGTKILLVEEIEDDKEHYIHLLHQNGYEVRVRKNLLLALESIRLEQPDLLILDLNLAKESLKETFLLFKDEIKNLSFPILFMLNRTDHLWLTEEFNCLRIDYLFRPVIDKELLFRINKHLQIFALISSDSSVKEKLKYKEKIERLKNFPEKEHLKTLPDKLFLKLYRSVKDLDAKLTRQQIEEIAKYSPEMTELINFCLEEYSLGALSFVLEDEKNKREAK